MRRSSQNSRPRPRFRSLSTSLPDVDGNKGFELPFNCLSSFDPTDEIDENGESKDLAEILEKVAEEEIVRWDFNSEFVTTIYLRNTELPVWFWNKVNSI